MNKFLQNLFIVLFPFYPIWAWACYTITKKPVDFFVSLALLPFVLYFIVFSFRKLPTYLLFLFGFTTYHLVSVFANDLVPPDSNWLYFVLTDNHFLACLFFIVVEYTEFDSRFIDVMSRNIVIIIIISLIVSVIQIKNPAFFFNVYADQDMKFIEEQRNFSIYSWANLNSNGVTFPILVAVALSMYEGRKMLLPMIIFCGIVVAFLTKARYVMLSAIIVLSQLFFNQARSLSKRIGFVLLLVTGVVVIGFSAKYFGVDIEEIINTRILEKESDMASAKARVLSYEVFLTAFPENPWLGVGPATRSDVVEALGGEAPLIHVGYLSYLYYYGIAGSLLLFLALFFLLKKAWSVGKRCNFWGSFYGLLAFVLANVSFVYFNLSEMGIVIAVIYIKYFNSIAEVEEEEEEEEYLSVENLPVVYE